ncbi:MAG: glucosidase family protein [Limisphaerales bacterium]
MALALLVASAPTPRAADLAPTVAPVGDEIRFLTDATRRLLAGCRVPARDGTPLYTPDGKGNYQALWTRDFAYLVENAGDLMPLADIEADIRYLLKGQRTDGAIPDRVRPDGVPVYTAGGEDHPLGEPNIDNPQFLVIAVDAYLKRIPAARRRALFREWSAQLDRGMDYIPRNDRGLVFNDPQKPHSPYGFTDCIGKTGELLMESLLYWTACERLAVWHRRAGDRALAREHRSRAKLIEANLGALWNADIGAFNAATGDCRQIDIWGNAYAVYAGFPLGARRERVLQFLVNNYDHCVWHGQVRHLLAGEYWQRLLTPVAHDRYQNGAYWATASGWVMVAIAKKQPDRARQMFADLIADFRANGICECVTGDYRQLPSYVVSAANPLAAARRLYVRPGR